MRSFTPLTVIVYALTLTGLSIALGGAYVLHRISQAEQAQRAAEAGQKKRSLEADRIKVGAKFARDNLKVEPAKDLEWVPRVAVYGRVVPNPRASTEVRAPFAGRLAAANGVT